MKINGLGGVFKLSERLPGAKVAIKVFCIIGKERFEMLGAGNYMTKQSDLPTIKFLMY